MRQWRKSVTAVRPEVGARVARKVDHSIIRDEVEKELLHRGVDDEASSV